MGNDERSTELRLTALETNFFVRTEESRSLSPRRWLGMVSRGPLAVSTLAAPLISSEARRSEESAFGCGHRPRRVIRSSILSVPVWQKNCVAAKTPILLYGRLSGVQPGRHSLVSWQARRAVGWCTLPASLCTRSRWPGPSDPRATGSSHRARLL